MDGLEIENLSGSTKTIGSTRRYNRDPGGRFARRKQTEVGPLGPAGGVGEGGVDAVSGRYIPGVRNHAVLRDPLDPERVHTVGPSRAPFIAAEQEQNRAHENLVNHVLGCRACATGGAL